ncbi:uncharacterized protein LOC118183506 isoform X2 [Stegodyphus dumicola]|uniref:uncharacterized protein LOC118183506 isoform X2 n=1 Tax=Stegodyphus dumicola TaxID=202533 RepID=UPI0015B0EFDE|nr:uncharacterized protein LOC118183506 isoform X2 [Stegodyphus dumicola]
MYSCDFSIDHFKISSEIDVTPFKAKLKAAESGVAYFMNPLNFNLKSFTRVKNEDVSEHEQQQNNAASKGIKLEEIASSIEEDKSTNSTVCTDKKSKAVKSNHLNYIQKYIQEVRNLLAKKVFPACAIRDAAHNMKITDKIDLQVNMDPKSPKHKPVFNARFSIENHLIASSNGSSKKHARVTTLESAINIMLNPSELVSVLSNVCKQCRDKALEDTFSNNMHISSIADGSEKAESDLSVNLEQHKISVKDYCHPQEKSGKTEPVILTNSEQIRTSPENNLTFQEMPGKVEPGLSTEPKQQRKNNHNVPKMGNVISYRNNNKQNLKKLCFSDMDDQTLIKILSGRLKNITQKNMNSYNKILLAVRATNMMDFIKFNTTTNSNITGDNLTFCCEFYVRNTLIASGTGLEVKKAMQKACENTLSVLTGESIDNVAPPCETETSLYDAVSSKLKNVSFDCVNKPLFDSSVQRKFVLLDDSEYKLKCDTNPTSILIASAAFSHKACTYKYETVESGMPQKLIRAEINFDGETVGSGTGTTKKEAKLAAARDTLEKLRKKVYTIKVKNQDASGFTIEPEQLRSAPAVSSALTEDNIGCKMMKMMGWTGGGIGKSSGITEPISIASRFGVQTSSYGKGNNRYMIVKRRFQVLDLLYLLLQSGGSTEKYELVDRST